MVFPFGAVLGKPMLAAYRADGKTKVFQLPGVAIESSVLIWVHDPETGRRRRTKTPKVNANKITFCRTPRTGVIVTVYWEMVK